MIPKSIKILSFTLIVLGFLNISIAKDNNLYKSIGISMGDKTFCTKSLIKYKDNYFIIGAGHSVGNCDKLVVFNDKTKVKIDLIARGDSTNLEIKDKADWAIYKIKEYNGGELPSGLEIEFNLSATDGVYPYTLDIFSDTENKIDCGKATEYKGELFFKMCTSAGDSGAPYINSNQKVVAIHSARTKDNAYSIGSKINNNYILQNTLECAIEKGNNYKNCNIDKITTKNLKKIIEPIKTRTKLSRLFN